MSIAESKCESEPILSGNQQPITPDEADAEASLDLIRQVVHSEFHSLVSRRLVENQLSTWRDAFEPTGKGSTFERAKEIRDIYEEAAPIPNAVMTEVSAELLAEVRRIVSDAVDRQKGMTADGSSTEYKTMER